MKLNTRLEDIFNVAPNEPDPEMTNDNLSIASEPDKLKALASKYEREIKIFDKIDEALPLVTGLEQSERELDEIAEIAIKGYTDLSELGQNVEVRHAAEIYSAATNLLGHALTARKNKIEKKLKMIDLQLRKRKLDIEKNNSNKLDPMQQPLEGRILNHRDLLEECKTENSEESLGIEKQ